MTMSNAKPVAIIAIHGVGDQAPCETARHMAQLLLRITASSDDAALGAYSSFEEHSILVPVVPIKTELLIDPPEVHKATLLSSSSEFLRSESATTCAKTVDTDFTRSLINEYDGNTEPHGYQTLMLEGTRSEVHKACQPIHVYEMYWGDLSRLGSGLLAVMGEMYQLLLHAGSIARTTADLQWAAAKKNKIAAPLLPLLSVFRWSVGASIWLSTVPLVAVNFVLVAVALTLVPLTIPLIANSAHIDAAGVGMALAALVGLFFVLQIYNARRPGVMKWGMAVAAIAIAIAIWRIHSGASYQATVLSVAEVVFHLLWPLALLILKLIVFLLLLAIPCVAFKKQAAARAKTIPQGVITAITAVIVPLSLSCVITVLLWAGSAAFLKSALDAGKVYESVVPAYIYKLPSELRPSKWPPKIPIKKTVKGEVDNSQIAFVTHLQQHGGSEAFNWMITGVALSLVCLVLGTLLSIKDELTPPHGPRARELSRVDLGGTWLNAGLTTVPLIALIVLIAFAAAAMLIPIFAGCVPGQESFWCGNDLTSYIGLFIAASSGGLLALGKAYSRGLGVLRPGLDLALDVDNWLRERPKKSNPRARILSRYLALLKYLNARGYERVVIVAHSQGTVITADLLRLLKTTNWHDKLNIRLFTLGSPLRQLYAERFPDLYGWVTNFGGPEPSYLHGVTYWLNGYRSGDYVGRALWEDLLTTQRFVAGPAPQDFVPTDLQTKKLYGEFCVGAGAHTHYFDYTAPDVATAIDLLIAD
jgi:hypothetical protein